MAVADSSEKRPEWCPPGRSPPVTRPVRPGSQSSSGSSSKRSNSSSSSRNSPSPTTPLSLAPSTKVRRKSSKQPSNPQFSRPRPSSPASDDGAVSQTSSPDIHDKFKEPDLEPCQRTPSLSSLFSLPKELFFVRDSGQSYELGLSSGQDILTLGSRLAEETQMRCRVQKQLDELDAQLTKVSEHCDEAQSRANDLEQQLNSALEVQAAQQISNQFKSACILSDDRPMPDNPEEFTPENFIWVKQQWDRVAEENLKMDTSLHIAGAQKHRLETEIVRLSRELEKYRKRNIGHGRSMTDAAQQTKKEPPRMTTVATQTDFVDQNNTENKPIESEHQAAPPQLPKVVMTDAAVQAAEQLDEHTLSEQLSDQNTKVSGLLEVSIQESREERLDWELDVCDIQKASVQGSSSQTEASKGKEIACPTTVAHNGQRSMTLGIWPPQPLASNISQENSIVRLQWENERLRKENQRLRNALEQHQNENSRPEGPESQNSNASSEEAQVRNTDNRAEIQDADVEMRGITVGQVSAAQLNIEALVVPAIPPETSEAGEILQFNLQRFLSSINRDRIASSDDAKRRRDSQRHERRRQREQWRIERDEEARQQQRERSQREEDARRHQQRRLRRERETQRTHKHHKQSLKVCKQKKKVPSLLGWVRYRRTWMGSFSFSYMFPPPLELS